jgi:radical SAM superfamily enzyme YgiQ (UPF0313 family)
VAEYQAKLAEGWDIVGFTFFQRHIAEIMEMADYARKQGVREIWAGGYGAFADEVNGFADRVILGYAEERLHLEFTGRKLERLLHPPIVIPILGNFHPKLPRVTWKKMGYIFSQRGCPFKCTFCQTPAHSPKPYRVPLESIEEALRYYRSVGINEVYSFDETFYLFYDHSEAVVDLFAKYKMNWWTATRANRCVDRLKDWSKKGLINIGAGLESVSEANLQKIKKGVTLEEVRDFRRTATENGIFAASYYMIGYEEDTVESVMRDFEVVRDFGFNVYLLTVLTPYPKTPLWDEIESKYGIFDKDFHHFDAKHLVWNHPNITPQQMQFLLQEGKKILNDPLGNYGKGVAGVVRKHIRDKGWRVVWEDVVRPMKSLVYDEQKHQVLPPAFVQAQGPVAPSETAKDPGPTVAADGREAPPVPAGLFQIRVEGNVSPASPNGG